MSIETNLFLLVESPAGFFRLTNTMDEVGNFAIVSVNQINQAHSEKESIPLGLCFIYEWVAVNNSPREGLPLTEFCLINHARTVLRTIPSMSYDNLDYSISYRGRRFTTVTKLPNKRYTDAGKPY